MQIRRRLVIIGRPGVMRRRLRPVHLQAQRRSVDLDEVHIPGMGIGTTAQLASSPLPDYRQNRRLRPRTTITLRGLRGCGTRAKKMRNLRMML